MRWLKSKYYPVNIDQKVIYNDPQRTEGACSLVGKYRSHHTIGIRGARLNQYACYEHFEVRPPLQG